MKCVLTTRTLRIISRSMGIENIYLQNLNKIFLFSAVVAILLFLCCHLLLGFVCVWQNGTLGQGTGSRHMFLLKIFANDTSSFLQINSNYAKL